MWMFTEKARSNRIHLWSIDFQVMNLTRDCPHLRHDLEVSVITLTATKTYSPGLLVLYCAVSIIAAIFSLSGNAVVFLTVACFPELRITSNLCLASFALANIFEGLCLYISCFVSGVFTLQGSCPSSGLIRDFFAFLGKVSVYCSLLNLTLVTVERYIGVMYSLRYNVILHENRTVKLIAGVWIISFLIGIPDLIDYDRQVSPKLMTVVFSLTFIVAVYSSIRMYGVSRRQHQQIVAQAHVLRQTTEANHKLRFRGSRTILVILLTLFICLFPALVLRFFWKPSSEAQSFSSLTLAIPWTSVLFGMYCCISPFVYFFRSQELRRYSKKLFSRGLQILTFP